MRKLSVIIALLIIMQRVDAQSILHNEFFVGYGFIEGFNIGSIFKINSGKQSVSFLCGYDNLSGNDQKIFSVSTGFNISFFRFLKFENEDYKWFINNNLVYWQLTDHYYKWKIISFIPTICRKAIVFQKFNVSIELGPAFNIVLDNQRKTYKEVGWPYHIIPDFRILVFI